MFIALSHVPAPALREERNIQERIDILLLRSERSLATVVAMNILLLRSTARSVKYVIAAISPE